jgi:hypothetical protein
MTDSEVITLLAGSSFTTLYNAFQKNVIISIFLEANGNQNMYRRIERFNGRFYDKGILLE